MSELLLGREGGAVRSVMLVFSCECVRCCGFFAGFKIHHVSQLGKKYGLLFAIYDDIFKNST